jgi:hypothetical protein
MKSLWTSRGRHSAIARGLPRPFRVLIMVRGCGSARRSATRCSIRASQIRRPHQVRDGAEGFFDGMGHRFQTPAEPSTAGGVGPAGSLDRGAGRERYTAPRQPATLSHAPGCHRAVCTFPRPCRPWPPIGARRWQTPAWHPPLPTASGRAGQDYGRRRELAFRPNSRCCKRYSLGRRPHPRLAEDAASGCGFT